MRWDVALVCRILMILVGRLPQSRAYCGPVVFLHFPYCIHAFQDGKPGRPILAGSPGMGIIRRAGGVEMVLREDYAQRWAQIIVCYRPILIHLHTMACILKSVL